MRRLICAVFCVLVPLSAHAAFLGNLGSVPPGVSDTRVGLTPGAYDDYYNFLAASDVTNANISFVLDPSTTGFFLPGAFSIELYAGTTPAGSPLAQGLSGGVPGVSFLADLTANTTYTIRTAFSFNAGAGITVDATTSISAVPIPSAVWLFATGLLGLVGIARRGKPV
jgi:hypothetical protein